MAHAIAMIHVRDPGDEIREEVAATLADVTVLGARLLVAVYVRPEKTLGGIIITGITTGEDRYQGKVGLVLQCGPIAFQDDATHRFGGKVPKVGDWVVFAVGDTFALEMGKRRVRMVEDVDVHMIISRPDAIW